MMWCAVVIVVCVQLPAAHRDAILGTLKDLGQVDKYLLGTDEAMSKIEALQKHLSDKGMDMVTILTPKRVYRVVRSRSATRHGHASKCRMIVIASALAA